jgi:hypothetical protein
MNSKKIINHTYKFTGLFNNIKNTPINNNKSQIPNFSKLLSKVNKDIFIGTVNINNALNSPVNNNPCYSNKLINSTVKLLSEGKINNNKFRSNVLRSESFYQGSVNIDQLKVRNLKTNLNTIFSMSKVINNLTFFNFNLETNLNIAKQQRWFAKNSLLSESIVPNSFLITQSKNLIGSRVLDKDFSNNTLWVPTKVAKLSSFETVNYFNNMLSQFLNKNLDNNELLSSNLLQSNFQNLNFFENSRF